MRVVVAQEQANPAETLRGVLLGMGMECGAADCVSYADLPVRLARGGADLVLVRVGTPAHAAQGALHQALTLTRAPLLALGSARDAQQILDTLHSGAREYLDEDRLQSSLETALAKMRAAGVVPAEDCRMVGVVSPTPGSGVTTVATNLAFTWAERHRDRVALVEMGREAAALALTLDLKPRFTMADVSENGSRLDASFLRQALVAHEGGVQVLAYKPETLDVAPLDPQAVRKALILLRTTHAAVALDLGHNFGPEHYEALRLCDGVVVVLRPDVPSLRQARRFLRACADQGVPTERLHLVANRYGQRGQLSRSQAREAVGAPIAEFLPEDSGRLNHALNQGKPLVRVSRFGSLVRRFARLAGRLAGKR